MRSSQTAVHISRTRISEDRNSQDVHGFNCWEITFHFWGLQPSYPQHVSAFSLGSFFSFCSFCISIILSSFTQFSHCLCFIYLTVSLLFLWSLFSANSAISMHEPLQPGGSCFLFPSLNVCRSLLYQISSFSFLTSFLPSYFSLWPPLTWRADRLVPYTAQILSYLTTLHQHLRIFIVYERRETNTCCDEEKQ